MTLVVLITVYLILVMGLDTLATYVSDKWLDLVENFPVIAYRGLLDLIASYVAVCNARMDLYHHWANHQLSMWKSR